MKKILSVFMAVSMILLMMVTSFAAEVDMGGSYTLSLVPSKTSVAVGDTFTVDVVLADTTGADIDFTGVIFGATVKYPTTLTLDSSATTTSNNLSKANFAYSDGQAILAIAADTVSATFNENTPVITLTFTVNASSTEGYKLTLSNDGIMNAMGSMVMVDGEGCTLTEAANKNPAEEIFEEVTKPAAVVGTIESDDKSESITLTDAAKQVAVFGKAKDVALEAGEYGIIFGGKEFPGAAKVNAGEAWCIRLIAPNGIIGEALTNNDSDDFIGTYSFKIFNGEAISEAKTVTVD